MTTSPGLPEDTTTDVEWVSASTAFLYTPPSLPAPIGFGAATTGGHGGQLIHVDIPDDGDQPGCLRWALDQPGPKWVVFEDHMQIWLEEELMVPSDTTIDGRGHRVVVRGSHTKTSGLHIHEVENVIIEALTVGGFGDPELTDSNDPFDAISVLAASRVWIDHCELGKTSDKALGLSKGVEGMTVSWCHFHDQQQTFQMGNMTHANDDVRNAVTVVGNHFDHCGYRIPVTSYGKTHVLNNYIEGWDQYAVRSQRIGQVFLEGNVFYCTKANSKATTIVPANDGANDSGSLQDDRDGYLYDAGNLYLGEKCKKQSTGPSHVFNPKDAYAYAALPATEELAEEIKAYAGPKGAV